MKKRNGGFWLAFPALAGFVAFYLIPMMITIWYSLSFGIGQREYVGLSNYRELFENQMFRKAVANTCRFFAVSIPVLLILSLSLAIIFYGSGERTRLLRLIYFYPMVLPVASVILGVQMIFGDKGMLNFICILLEVKEREWLYSHAAFWIMCILYWWKYMGFHMMIFYTRLLLIPKNYYEYAKMFGAGRAECFRYITLPFILPVLGFNILLAIMNSFKCYKEAFVIGGNYPDESIYVLQHFMNNNFQHLNYQKISTASVTILLAVFLCVVSVYGVYRIRKGCRRYV